MTLNLKIFRVIFLFMFCAQLASCTSKNSESGNTANISNTLAAAITGKDNDTVSGISTQCEATTTTLICSHSNGTLSDSIDLTSQIKDLDKILLNLQQIHVLSDARVYKNQIYAVDDIVLQDNSKTYFIRLTTRGPKSFTLQASLVLPTTFQNVNFWKETRLKGSEEDDETSVERKFTGLALNGREYAINTKINFYCHNLLSDVYPKIVCWGDKIGESYNWKLKKVDCGNGNGSVADRIKDCEEANLGVGSKKIFSSTNRWSLVKFTDGKAVAWRDDRTGLVWSNPLTKVGIPNISLTYPCTASNRDKGSFNCALKEEWSGCVNESVRTGISGISFGLPTVDEVMGAIDKDLYWVFFDDYAIKDEITYYLITKSILGDKLNDDRIPKFDFGNSNDLIVMYVNYGEDQRGFKNFWNTYFSYSLSQLVKTTESGNRYISLSGGSFVAQCVGR